MNVTSTVSPGVKADPLAVIVPPARPDAVDNASDALGRGVALGSGVATATGGVGAPVAWPNADAGMTSRLSRRTPSEQAAGRLKTVDPGKRCAAWVVVALSIEVREAAYYVTRRLGVRYVA